MSDSAAFGVAPIQGYTEASRDGPDRYLHVAFFNRDDSVLTERKFRLAGVSGRESVSQPFEFELELRADTVSDGGDLSVSDFLGLSATWGINDPGVETSKDDDSEGSFAAFMDAVSADRANGLSVFNGIVTRFAMNNPGVYSASLKPALWRLSLTNGYRVYESLSIADLLSALLEKHGVRYSIDGLSGDMNPALYRVQDWLQAGESDFDLFHRVLSKAHIYYFFRHTPRGHTLVLANVPAYVPLFADDRPLRYVYTEEEHNPEQTDLIKDLSYEETLQSTGVLSTHSCQEAASEKDSVARLHSYHGASKEVPGDRPFHAYKPYQYGGSETEANHFAKVTQDTVDAAASAIAGTCTCMNLRVGSEFRITNEPSCVSPKPVLMSLSGRRFVATEVQHEATDEGRYRNRFRATDAASLISPFNMRDTHQGVLQAVVVGHGRDTPPASWKYYEKSEFVWGRDWVEDKNQEPSKTWEKGVFVRFCTQQPTGEPIWVKLAPHMQTVPEIGSSVLVTRANDESELPEIQSIVQSNGSFTVTPEKWTANTHVGNSYSTNYGDSKSVRYAAGSRTDLRAATALVESAYATGEYRDVSFSQGGSYSKSVSENGRDGLLSRSYSEGSTYSHHQGAVSDSYTDVDRVSSTQIHRSASSDTTISGLSESTSEIGESTNVSNILGDSTGESAVGGNSVQDSTISGDSDSTSVIGGDSTSTHTVEGMSTSTQTFRKKSKNNSTYDGDLVSETTVNGDSRNTHTVTGLSRSHTALHTALNTTTVVGQSSNSLIGGTNDNSATGVRNANSAVGADVTVHTALAQMSVELVGAGVSLRKYGIQKQLFQEADKYSLTLVWIVL